MRVQENHQARWARAASHDNVGNHPSATEDQLGKAPAVSPKPSPMKQQQGSGESSGQVARLPLPRAPDAAFKLQTEGPTAQKEQRLDQPRGAKPDTRKPQPAPLASENQGLAPDYNGEAVVARQLGGPVTLSDPGKMTPGTLPSAPEPESFWHIVADTLQHPAQRLYQSYAHLGALVFKGRFATGQELDIARKLGIPIQVAAQMLLPPVAIAGGIGTAIGAVEQWAKDGTVDPKALADAQTSVGKPGLAEPVNTRPSTTPKSNAGNFKPPRRLEDGRVGYPLSPTSPPRFPEPQRTGDSAGSAQASHLTPADALAEAGPSDASSARHSSQASTFRPEYHLVTQRDPSTGNIVYKEFARDELHIERKYDGSQSRYDEDVTTDGYHANYRGKGFEAIVMHGARKRKGAEELFTYQRGRNVRVIFQKDIPKASVGASVEVPIRNFQTFDYTRDVSAEALVNHLRVDQGIDLVSPKYGGTGSSNPLYLLSCHALRGGVDSIAQQMADATGRQVRAHSSDEIYATDPKLLGEPRLTPLAGSVSSRLVAWLQNIFRPNRRNMAQLVHKTVEPRPDVAAQIQARREASRGRPLTFQQFPRPDRSPFTSTESSLASSVGSNASRQSTSTTQYASSEVELEADV